MFFYFPDQCEVKKLRLLFEEFVQMLEREDVEYVDHMQISLLGFRGEDRLQMVLKDGRIGTKSFERERNGDLEYIDQWKETKSVRFEIRPSDREYSPLAKFMDMDD